jgi:hypothetical protein
MNTPTQSFAATLTQTLRLTLARSQAEFQKNPNATNWNRTQLLMLAWQQWHRAINSPAARRWDVEGIAAVALGATEVAMPELVVRSITGRAPCEIL